MATGANDKNGIYQYGEDDPVSPFSTLLNKLASSVSSVVGAIRNDISTLQTTATSLSQRLNTKGGYRVASTDGSGNVVIAHGLGKTPTTAQVTDATTGSTIGRAVPVVVALDANNVTVRYMSIATPGTAFGNNPVGFYWSVAG
jgi:hypothetical protein